MVFFYFASLALRALPGAKKKQRRNVPRRRRRVFPKPPDKYDRHVLRMDDMKQQAMMEETRSEAEGIRAFYAAYTKQRGKVFVVSGFQ